MEPFARFFDDAAIFPPGSADLSDAVRDHLARRRTVGSALVGPLLLTPGLVAPAARLAAEPAAEPAAEAVAAGAVADTALRVGLVVAPGCLAEAAALAAAPGDGIVVSGVELKTDARWRSQVREAISLAADVGYDVHIELDEAGVAGGGVSMLAGTGARLKYRTGGLRAALFPTLAILAQMIAVSVREGVSFKLTAGLHRAVRHRDPATGFTRHGFLNIAVGVALARAGAETGEIVAVLAQENPTAVVRAFDGLADGAWRSSFESFGTCSIAEPVEDLVALGLLDRRFLDPRPISTPTGAPR